MIEEYDLFGVKVDPASSILGIRFGVPPFSVLSAARGAGRTASGSGCRWVSSQNWEGGGRFRSRKRFTGSNQRRTRRTRTWWPQ